MGLSSRNPYLSSLSSNATSELDILGHDGDALGVDGAEVGVLEEPNEVGLTCLLESLQGGTLEAKPIAEVLGNLPDKTLEWKLQETVLEASRKK